MDQTNPQLITVNNSAGKPNWSQLKNHYFPLSTCNVSACVNAAQAAGWDVMAARCMGEERPADDLLKFIQNDGLCINRWHALDPDEVYPPNQWLAVLALGLGRWLGTGGGFPFDENANPQIMAQAIIAGGACIVSGHYPATKENGDTYNIDHITALVGLTYYNELPVRVESWIMDDSYGDYRTRYTSRMGNDIEMPKKDFELRLKAQGSKTKRCIFVPKKGILS